MSNCLTEFGRVLWLAAPVVFAGVIHVVVIRCNLLGFLEKPLDLGAQLRGRRVFGANKTLRGAIVMIGGAIAGTVLQGIFRSPTLECFDYGTADLPLIGFLLGAGFILGELPNSFLKRQCGITPGGRGGALFVFLDQVDSILGSLALISLVWLPPCSFWILSLLVGVVLHVLVNGIFVISGLKRHVF